MRLTTRGSPFSRNRDVQFAPSRAEIRSKGHMSDEVEKVMTTLLPSAASRAY